MHSKSLERQREYKKKFENLTKPLYPLVSAFSSFKKSRSELKIADNLSTIITNDSSETCAIIKSALLGSAMINYSKPFMEGKSGNHKIIMSDKFLTKNKEFNTNIHVAILELRNNLIAHANKDFEKTDFRFLNATIESTNPSSKARQVYLPMKFIARHELLDSIAPDKMELISDHFSKALDLTGLEIRKILDSVRDLMMEYNDISNTVDKTFSLNGQEIVDLSDQALRILAFQENFEGSKKFKLGKDAVNLLQLYLTVDIPREPVWENDFCKIYCTPNSETGITNIQVEFKV